MDPINRITTVTRQHITDNITISQLWYHGRYDEPSFLNRLYDLKKLHSTDSRYDNAQDDIWKHTVMNTDWPLDWVFSDHRFNLMTCPDEQYLKFLCETIHPAVRSNNEEVDKMLKIFNEALAPDGYELIKSSEISGKPVFAGVLLLEGAGSMHGKKTDIIKHLDTAYINSKINTMNEAIYKDTDLAIGTAKELLETVCKSILKQKNIEADKNWSIARLLKETSTVVDFTPRHANEPDKAAQSIRQILSGIGTSVQAVAELRNAYGSGHGKDANFQGLEPAYAKFIVGVVAEVAILYLNINGVETPIVEIAASEEEENSDLPF